MTTILKIDNQLSQVQIPIATGGPLTTFFIGTHRYRSSTGGDRNLSPSDLWTMVAYMTKPYIYKDVIVRPAELKFRKVWKKPPRRFSDEEHAYTAEYVTLDQQGCIGIKRFGDWYNCGTPLNWNLQSVPDPWSADDQFALLGKLRESIAGSSFNAGVAIAEFGKSIDMITRSATKIHAAYRAVRHGNPVKAAQLLTGKVPPRSKTSKLKSSPEAASSNWLELQYGWLPLVKDSYDAAVFLDNHLRYPVIQRRSVTRNAGGVASSTALMATSQPYAQHRVRIRSSTRLVAKLRDVDVTRLSGLTDPASVAWELVPFSFVADWFIPIGNYLDAQALQRSLTGTFITTHRFSVRSLRMPAVTSWQLSDTNNGSKANFERLVLTRSISTSLSIPQPEIRSLGKVASWKHCVNAVALLVNSKASRD